MEVPSCGAARRVVPVPFAGREMSRKQRHFAGMAVAWSVALLTVTPGTMAAQGAGMETTVDDPSVHAFWSELDQVWAERDPDRFTALFTEEASFQFVNRGEALEGEAAIHRFFVDQFSRQSPELRHLTTVNEVRAIGEGVRAMDGQVRVVRPGAEGTDDATVFATLAIFGILNRGPDGWRVHILRAYDLPVDE